jgi:PAS domain S-box-containing protein
MTVFNIKGLKEQKENTIKNTTEAFISQNKEKIKIKVRETISQIEYMRLRNYEDLKDSLKQKVDTLNDILNIQYSFHRGSESNKNIKKELLRIIQIQNKKGKDKYIFALDIKTGKVLAHKNKKLIGKKFLNKKDDKGTYLFKSKVEILKTKKSAFQELYFKKENDSTKKFKKLSYFIKFEPFDWIIGTCKNIKENEDNLKNNITDKLNSTQKDLRNYVFVSDIKNINGGKDFAKFLVMPNIPEKIGKFISDDFQDVRGKYIRKVYLEGLRQKGEVFVDYWYKKPYTKEHGKKISYFYHYKPWNWIIGCGFYFDELDKFIKNKEILIDKQINKEIERAILIAFISLLFAILVFYSFAKSITSKLQKINNDLNTKNTKLEELKDKLEDKVEARTNELSLISSQLQNYLNTIQSILIVLDKNGFITLINPEGAKLLGYEKDELISQNWFQKCLHKINGTDMSYIHFKQIMNSTQELLKYHESNLVTKDGKQLFVAWHNAILKDDNGDVKGIISSGMNITEQKKLEEELIHAKNLAEESTKAKSNFLANMSHEIRTPMNGIIGMSHLALKTDLNEKQKNYVDKINLSANSLLGIINDILDISKIEAGKLEIYKDNFNLFQDIQNIINLIEVKARGKDIHISLEYDLSLEKVFYGDSLRIGQILTNLLTNGVKFTEIGEVKLIVTKQKDDRVRFEIRDTGIGLKEEQIKNLFKSFSQADSSTTKKYGGTGLGLAISKQLIELMNGKIWVESKFQKGSRFIFEIDLEKQIIKKDDDSVIDKDKNYILNEMKTLKGSNILLVEDNKINQEIIIDLLQEFDINIDLASNGHEAIMLFEQNKNKYELILMDIQMPILDGYEATKEIRFQKSDIPIIALTANAMIEDAKRTKAVGVNEHLNKPIEVEKLYKVLLKYISKKVEIDEVFNDEDMDEQLNPYSDFPDFDNLDKKYALDLLMGNKNAFLELLKGVLVYKNSNFEKMDDDEFKRTMHTIKALIASLGADSLSQRAKHMEKTLDRSFLADFQNEFNNLLTEIEIKVFNGKDSLEKEDISNELKDKLFSDLKEAVSTKRIKKTKPIVEKLDKYKLDDKDEKLFSELKQLITKFKFKEAIELFDSI